MAQAHECIQEPPQVAPPAGGSFSMAVVKVTLLLTVSVAVIITLVLQSFRIEQLELRLGHLDRNVDMLRIGSMPSHAKARAAGKS